MNVHQPTTLKFICLTIVSLSRFCS